MTESSFDKEKTIQYWIECAAYDLETAKSLMAAKRFPYALFLAHLALEKALKALVVKETGNHAPFTHSLIKLAVMAKIQLSEEQTDKLAEYKDFHIEARYPDEKKSFYQKCTVKFASEKFAEMEELHSWLIKKLKQ